MEMQETHVSGGVRENLRTGTAADPSAARRNFTWFTSSFAISVA
jgi:hypothetical protein